jgi:hypothetical protein
MGKPGSRYLAVAKDLPPFEFTCGKFEPGYRKMPVTTDRRNTLSPSKSTVYILTCRSG